MAKLIEFWDRKIDGKGNIAHPLNGKNSYLVGRSQICDVKLKPVGRFISREHVILVNGGGRYSFGDISSNGTSFYKVGEECDVSKLMSHKVRNVFDSERFKEAFEGRLRGWGEEYGKKVLERAYLISDFIEDEANVNALRDEGYLSELSEGDSIFISPYRLVFSGE